MNIFTVFSRAAAGVALTPQERAFLRLVEGLVMTALVAAAGAFLQLLATGQVAFNQATLDAVGTAAFLALVTSVKKLVSASGDGRVASASPLPAAPLHQQAAPPASAADASAI